MPAAAGALQEPGHPFGPADLYHGLYRGEVDPQVEAGGANHCFEAFVSYGLFYPLPGLLVDAAMVHGDLPGQFGVFLKQFLEPDLALPPGIGKEQGGLAVLYYRDDRFQQVQAQVPAPWEGFHAFGEKASHRDLLVELGPDQHGVGIGLRVGPQQYLPGLVEVADGG